MVGKTGIKRREQLENLIENRKSCARDDGVYDKFRTERFPSEQIARGVHYKTAYGRRNAQPVVQEKRKSEHASFGNG